MVLLRRRSARWTLALLAATTLALVGCSDDDSASTTTTTRPTTTTAPPSTTAPPEAAEPLPVAWVRQVGGPGDDELRSVTGRDDSVLGAGTTTGLAASTPPASGATAAFVDVVAAADGTPTATTQATQDRTAAANGIADGPDTGSSGTQGDAADTPSVTLACGTTPSAPAADRPVVGPAGGTDAWCASVGADGALGPAQAVGSDLDDDVRSVAVHASRSDAAGSTTELGAYAVGRTVGLFPEAKDPTGGYLGEGDALVTRLDRSGAVQWARQFGTTASDEANAVTTSDDGDAIVGGSTEGRTDGDVGGTIGGVDAWMARIDPRGNLRWLTQFGSTAEDRALAVASGGDPRRGTEIFVGAGTTGGAVGTSASLGGTDALVSAFDASGRQLWAVQLGSTVEDRATGVVVDGSTVYVSGTTAGEIIGGQRISLTPSASPDPAGPDSSTTTAPDSSAPDTTAPPAGGGEDGFLAAIDAETGEVRWVAQFGSTGDELVSSMTRTESGLIVLAGSTTGQLGTTPAAGGTDGFMIAFVPPSGGGGAASMV